MRAVHIEIFDIENADNLTQESSQKNMSCIDLVTVGGKGSGTLMTSLYKEYALS